MKMKIMVQFLLMIRAVLVHRVRREALKSESVLITCSKSFSIRFFNIFHILAYLNSCIKCHPPFKELAKEDDPDIMWAQSIGLRLKKLGPYERGVARRKIDEIVSELEYPIPAPINNLSTFNYDQDGNLII